MFEDTPNVTSMPVESNPVGILYVANPYHNAIIKPITGKQQKHPKYTPPYDINPKTTGSQWLPFSFGSI